jgi:hypothetical protein
MLTQAQRALLIWMVETGESSFLFEPVFGPTQTVTADRRGNEKSIRAISGSWNTSDLFVERPATGMT